MSTAPADKPLGIRATLWLEKYMPCVFLLLFIVLACMSGAYYHRVYQHPELFEPPYSPYIKPGTDGPLITVYLLVRIAQKPLTGNLDMYRSGSVPPVYLHTT